MELTHSLVDTYQRYKKGTENFVQWLSETARATGKVGMLFKPSGGGRLKGKARTDAKKAGQLTSHTMYQVHIGSFEDLAHAIVGSETYSVPRSALLTLRAVIKGRKRCAAWYLEHRNKTNDNTDRDNKNHQYFIHVLENVLSILETKQSCNTQDTPPIEVQKSKKLNNLFEVLELEDTIDAEQIPDAIASTCNPTKTEYKLETAAADISFAIYCFLKDFTQIRMFIKSTWQEFKGNQVGLRAAALTMNAGIDMLERLSNDFEEAFPQFKSTQECSMHAKIVGFIQGKEFTNRSVGEDTTSLKDKEDGHSLDANAMMCSETTALIWACFYDKDWRANTTFCEEYVFLKSLTQLASLPYRGADSTKIYNGGDSVHKAISTMVKTGHLDSWIVFAVQIFKDTQETLGETMYTAKRLMEKGADDVLESYRRFLSTDKPGPAAVAHQANCIQEMMRIEILGSEMINQMNLDKLDSGKPWTMKGIEGVDFSLRAYHPALCGHLLNQFVDKAHRFFMDLTSEEGQIIVVAHLYNAAHESGMLPRSVKWKDLEWLIEQQGSEWIYVGDKPKTSPEILNRFNLVRGMKVTRLAKDFNDKKPGRIATWKGRIRVLKYFARYSNLMVDRSEKIGKRPSGPSRASGDRVVMATALAKDFLSTLEPNTSPSSLETLRAFKDAVTKDDFAYNMDFVGLYTRCFDLLREILAHCLKHAPLDFDRKIYEKDELAFNTVINELFNQYCGQRFRDKPRLPKAVALLRKVIETQGDVMLTKAKEKQEAQAQAQAQAQKSMEADPLTEQGHTHRRLKFYSDDTRNLDSDRIQAEVCGRIAHIRFPGSGGRTLTVRLPL